MEKENHIENNPKISIVIPVFNNFELTKNCIDSIKNAKIETTYEIIIADDGSTDGTVNIEKHYDNVRLIKTPQNMGFLLNVKNAIQHSNGDYIFLMNNDMIAKTKFLDYLYNTIISGQNIGIVGAMMLNEDSTIQEVGGTVWNSAYSDWNYYNKAIKSINISKLYDVDYCSGCGIMFSKKDWDTIGGFDEILVPAYYEDVDLCFQIKYNLGKRIVCYPKAQIFHLCGKTYNKDASQLVQTNRLKFLNKWGNKLNKKQIIYHKHFYQQLFSIVNTYDKNYKVITLFGIQISIKRHKN